MKGRLRIASVCFPSQGGSGRVAALLAHALAERGHEVHMVATGRPPSLPAITGVQMQPVELATYPVLEHPPYTVALASELLRLSESPGLDVVHAHYAVPHAAAAVLAQQAAPAPGPAIVTTLHGTDVTRVGRARSHQPMTRFCVEVSDAVTVPSASLARDARLFLELDDDSLLHEIPNFVDVEVFRPPEQRDRSVFDRYFEPNARKGPVVIHVSNLRPIKRIHDAVEALARGSTAARLVVIGDGPERGPAQGRAEALGIAHRVAFIGERRRVAPLLGHADVFIMPSETESFGLAALEALAAGVPVVATRVGGLMSVVQHDKNGFLLPVGDLDGLGQALERVLVEPGLRERLSLAAITDARERFRADPIVDRYEELYRSVAARRAAS